MQKLFLLIFSLLVTTGKAQLSDSFTDGDFRANPQWLGDSANFIVNADWELQLNAPASGASFLATPLSLSYADTLEWRLKVSLDFAPSSANYCRIYLLADTNNPQSALNGYFLQLGESLSNDAIELCRQSGTVITTICRGPDAQIASAFEIQIRVLRFPSGDWQVFTDENLAENYSLIASGFDTGTPNARYFFFDCNYTSGNLQRFFFDDIYSGEFIPDGIIPSCTSVALSTDSTIVLSFSEKLQRSSVNDLSNYNIITIGNPSQLTIDSVNDYTITLYFNQHFVTGIEYDLKLINLIDVAGNLINDTTIKILYYPIGFGNANDIVISEVYFEMSSISPLPNAEFVELYNRSDSAIDLSGWTISDGSSDAVFPKHLFSPKTFLVVFDTQNDQLFSAFPNRIGVTGFPGLNNDSGDTLTIYDEQNLAIESVGFNDDSYHDSNKKNGGWTVERVDLNFTCPDESNWKASENSFHGTPGEVNSVAGIHTDNTAPWVSNVFVVDSMHLQIDFSEEVFSTIIPNYFSVIDNALQVNDCISVNEVSSKSYLLEFANVFSDGISHLKILDTLIDCASNAIDLSVEYKFGKSENAELGDVVINELLFDPYEGGEDFVELFNCSSKIIDLNNWTVQEADYEDENSVKEETLLSTEHRILFPGEYLAFTRSPKSLLNNYSCPNPQGIIQLDDLPDYNSDEGRVVLRDQFGTKLDGFQYSEKLHFYLLNSPKGVSLERLNGYSGEMENVQWHSAASTVGFATPAYMNSHRVSENENSVAGKIELANEVFSPDNNGYEDLLAINYHFEEPGVILSLAIYTKDGFPVRELLVNKTVSAEGQIFWDGFTDSGKLALPGRYLVWAKSFSLDNGSNVFRTSCVVAMGRP
ncbi:MAG: lamin tail domain-containing protein [Bacteroidia bacterium]|nr:lamin tail domain-containing protein [Bacteroidia bacterium]